MRMSVKGLPPVITCDQEGVFQVKVKVRKGREWQPALLFVSDGVITAISWPGDEQKEKAGVPFYDFSSCFLVPGMVDCHLHFALNARNLQEAIASWSNLAENRRRVEDYLAALAAMGIVAVRDGGDAAGIGLLAKEMAATTIPAPRVFASGYAIYKKGRYGSFLGPGVASVEEALQRVRELAGKVDQIKVVQSGLVSFKKFGEVGPPQFTLKELQAIVDEAHSLGLKVMAHASGAEAVDIAVRAGVDSIEHGYFVMPATLELMAKKGTWWVPTLAPLANLLPDDKPLYEGASRGVIARTVADQQAKIRLARELGVPMAVGTDAGAVAVPHGLSYYDELRYLAESGLTAEEIMVLACQGGRALLGMEPMEEWQPGQRLTGVIFARDPLRNVPAVTDVRAVFLAGGEGGRKNGQADRHFRRDL